MKRYRRPVVALVLALSLCAALSAVVASRATADTQSTFVAGLNAAQETPPNASTATGTAVVQIEGSRISYQLTVSSLSNIVAAHIHLGQPGVAGPIVLTLPTATPIKGSFTGTLASGTMFSPQLEGPLAGQPLSALLAQIAAGNAYVNVHTNDAVPPPNTGPGDLPGGEIRGQLVTAGVITTPPTTTSTPTTTTPTTTTPATGGATVGTTPPSTGGTGGLVPGGGRGRGR